MVPGCAGAEGNKVDCEVLQQNAEGGRREGTSSHSHPSPAAYPVACHRLDTLALTAWAGQAGPPLFWLDLFDELLVDNELHPDFVLDGSHTHTHTHARAARGYELNPDCFRRNPCRPMHVCMRMCVHRADAQVCCVCTSVIAVCALRWLKSRQRAQASAHVCTYACTHILVHARPGTHMNPAYLRVLSAALDGVPLREQ